MHLLHPKIVLNICMCNAKDTVENKNQYLTSRGESERKYVISIECGK